MLRPNAVARSAYAGTRHDARPDRRFRDKLSMAKKRAARVANPIQKGGLACLKHSNAENIESPLTLHNLISTRFMPISFVPIGRKAFREKQWSAP